MQRWAYDTVGLGDLLYFIYTYYLDSNFDFSILYSSVVIAPSSNKGFNVFNCWYLLGPFVALVDAMFAVHTNIISILGKFPNMCGGVDVRSRKACMVFPLLLQKLLARFSALCLID